MNLKFNYPLIRDNSEITLFVTAQITPAVAATRTDDEQPEEVVINARWGRKQIDLTEDEEIEIINFASDLYHDV